MKVLYLPTFSDESNASDFLSCHDLDFPSDLRRILTIFRRLPNIAEMSEDVPTENEHSRNFSETHQFL